MNCTNPLSSLQELILEMAELKKYGKAESIGSDIEQPSDNLEIDQIMAKLEQDNKVIRRFKGNPP